MAPMLVPAIQWMGTRISSRTFSTPIWAIPRAPPPLNTRPIRSGRGSSAPVMEGVMMFKQRKRNIKTARKGKENGRRFRGGIIGVGIFLLFSFPATISRPVRFCQSGRFRRGGRIKTGVRPARRRPPAGGRRRFEASGC